MNNVIWKTKYETIKTENYRGKKTAFSYRKPFVIVVPQFTNGKVLLIKQHRPGMKREVMGFPGGFIERTESIHGAAERELREETGYRSQSMSDPLPLYENPSRSRKPFYVVIATIWSVPENNTNPDVREGEITTHIMSPKFLSSLEFYFYCQNAITLAATHIFLNKKNICERT